MTALIAARLVHYLAASVLFGASAFSSYGWYAASASQGRLPSWLKPMLAVAGLAALTSGILWFQLVRASLGDDDIAQGVWVFRLSLAGVLFLFLLFPRVIPQNRFLIFGSLILLASIPWTNPTGAAGSAAAPVRAFHLVAAGIWAGALFVFAGSLLQARRWGEAELRALHDSLAHFSGAGTAVVTALLLTGGFLLAVQGTSGFYTLVLAGKLVLFAAMLGFATANRYWLTPRLSVALDGGGDVSRSISALRHSVLCETLLAILVLGAVAVLGVL